MGGEKSEQASIEEEFKKTGISPNDISLLRSWLESQPHLPSQYITDLDLILVYHCCFRSSEIAKKVLDTHFTLRTHFTSFFADRHVDEKIIRALHTISAIKLKMPSHKNYTLAYHRLTDSDPKNFVLSDCVKLTLMLLDLYQYREGTWPGFVIIIDMTGVTLGHISRLDLQTIQQLMYFLQEAMLVRVKGVHFINAPAFMDRVMMLIKPFLKKNLLKLVHIHPVGSKSLEEFMPIEALPKEAGGEYMTLAEGRDSCLSLLKNNSDYFIEESKKRVVESLRPGKPKTITDIFGGIEGSFKKLDID